MTIFSEKYLPGLLDNQSSPSFSVYMPTYRTHPDNSQDQGVYKKLLASFESVRKANPRDNGIQSIFSKFDALGEDYHFWQHALDGLAVFAAIDVFQVYRLKRPVQPMAIVSDSFHVKPLLKYVQSADRYHVLALTINKVRLFEGDRYKLDEIDLSEMPNVPSSMIEVLDHKQRDLHATLSNYRTTTGEQWEEKQNHGLNKTDIDNDTEQFFRSVDRAIYDEYTKVSKLPVFLAALPEHHHLYRRVSQNERLAEEGIQINASAISEEELRNLAWGIAEKHYNERVDSVISDFRHAAAHQLGADQLDQIAKDAFDGKVGTLLIEENRSIPGKILDRDNMVYHDDNETDDSQVDDVLDDLGELVMRFGGEVWVIPKSKMPADTGAAAINRY